ncbi:hypothetical protein CDD83_4740 [Cordyceps sp. RAO-2017]|nr:hypothetical protein CDD83_4740 [Cordyceps sp. RAO-2017]
MRSPAPVPGLLLVLFHFLRLSTVAAGHEVGRLGVGSPRGVKHEHLEPRGTLRGYYGEPNSAYGYPTPYVDYNSISAYHTPSNHGKLAVRFGRLLGLTASPDSSAYHSAYATSKSATAATTDTDSVTTWGNGGSTWQKPTSSSAVISFDSGTTDSRSSSAWTKISVSKSLPLTPSAATPTHSASSGLEMSSAARSETFFTNTEGRRSTYTTSMLGSSNSWPTALHTSQQSTGRSSPTGEISSETLDSTVLTLWTVTTLWGSGKDAPLPSSPVGSTAKLTVTKVISVTESTENAAKSDSGASSFPSLSQLSSSPSSDAGTTSGLSRTVDSTSGTSHPESDSGDAFSTAISRTTTSSFSVSPSATATWQPDSSIRPSQSFLSSHTSSQTLARSSTLTGDGSSVSTASLSVGTASSSIDAGTTEPQTPPPAAWTTFTVTSSPLTGSISPSSSQSQASPADTTETSRERGTETTETISRTDTLVGGLSSSSAQMVTLTSTLVRTVSRSSAADGEVTSENSGTSAWVTTRVAGQTGEQATTDSGLTTSYPSSVTAITLPITSFVERSTGSVSSLSKPSAESTSSASSSPVSGFISESSPLTLSSESAPISPPTTQRLSTSAVTFSSSSLTYTYTSPKPPYPKAPSSATPPSPAGGPGSERTSHRSGNWSSSTINRPHASNSWVTRTIVPISSITASTAQISRLSGTIWSDSDNRASTKVPSAASSVSASGPGFSTGVLRTGHSTPGLSSAALSGAATSRPAGGANATARATSDSGMRSETPKSLSRVTLTKKVTLTLQSDATETSTSVSASDRATAGPTPSWSPAPPPSPRRSWSSHRFPTHNATTVSGSGRGWQAPTEGPSHWRNATATRPWRTVVDGENESNAAPVQTAGTDTVCAEVGGQSSHPLGGSAATCTTIAGGMTTITTCSGAQTAVGSAPYTKASRNCTLSTCYTASGGSDVSGTTGMAPHSSWGALDSVVLTRPSAYTAGNDYPVPTTLVTQSRSQFGSGAQGTKAPSNPNYPWGGDSPVHRHQNVTQLSDGIIDVRTEEDDDDLREP